jgi:flagellar basal-body rod protein FlgG
LYAAANGMIAVEDRQAVIANNIANAVTPGFKRQFAVQRGYDQAYFPNGRRPERFDIIVAPGGGVKTVETFSNFGNGVVTTTGGAMDVALLGPGFLRVDTPNGERFTRMGHFAIGDNDQLVTTDGNTVLSDAGVPIDLSGGEVTFNAAGEVLVDGLVRGRLGIAEFADPHALEREGYTLFRASQAAIDGMTPADETTIAPQSIEASNVALPSEMVSMLMALRAYAANQQAIQAINETAGRFINQVGGVS